ncbi:hypothetical protein [Enemella sp. A6]|uniref:hypothetical protein n=1 Tax=Enemella sp. A6 TaxID=3440152 RepID=UPI003EB84409
MDGWTILLTVIAALALALTVGGWLWDRRAGVKRRRAMTSPPDREIPDFRPDAVVPEYLTELEAREPVVDPSVLALTAGQRAEIKGRLDSAPSVRLGWLSKVFVTDPDEGWAVAPQPLVLVCADRVGAVRELYPVLETVMPQGRPLVLIAPEVDAEVVDVLEVNHLRGNLRVIVLLAGDTGVDHVAELVGATPVGRADLMSGYLAPDALGHCRWWVSSAKESWVIDGGVEPDVPPDADQPDNDDLPDEPEESGDEIEGRPQA